MDIYRTPNAQHTSFGLKIGLICLSISSTAAAASAFYYVRKDEVLMNQFSAIWSTLVDWTGLKSPKTTHDETKTSSNTCSSADIAVEIVAPGGSSQLRTIPIPPGSRTTGYNVARKTKILHDRSTRDDLVDVKVSHFSVNFADVCIRLGLYESAIRNVGYPIVPGFDVSGVVSSAPPGSGLEAGDLVYGATLFGGYSTHVSVPAGQVRRVPPALDPAVAAAIPAASLTAIHALSIAGFNDPEKSAGSPTLKNRSVLVHSAAGGVGGMLVQIARICGASNIVGVVGRSEKRSYVLGLGADSCISKEGKSLSEWWSAVSAANGGQGFAAIFDANGVETLGRSYEHLAMCGRLVVYGFHTNLTSNTSLSPLSWLRMAWGMLRMPRFDAMDMTLDSKAVMGFNLSFFEDETEVRGGGARTKCNYLAQYAGY